MSPSRNESTLPPSSTHAFEVDLNATIRDGCLLKPSRRQPQLGTGPISSLSNVLGQPSPGIGRYFLPRLLVFQLANAR